MPPKFYFKFISLVGFTLFLGWTNEQNNYRACMVIVIKDGTKKRKYKK